MYSIGLLVVLTQFIGVIKCGGILDLAFVKFIHNASELQCDSAECDFKYVICLDAANGDNLDVEDCFYRRLEEFELPEVAINFNHWPGALLLKVAIFDRKPSSDELVDTLHSLLEAEPGQGKQIEMHSKTSLTINFTVQCDKDFYGPLCSTFCVPQNNKIGHYSCDSATGTLVCHPGWQGRFCTDKVLEPKKTVDIVDNTLLSEEELQPVDSTAVKYYARAITTPTTPAAGNLTTVTENVTLSTTQGETFAHNSSIWLNENSTDELKTNLDYADENFTNATFNMNSTDLKSESYTTRTGPTITTTDPAVSKDTNIDFLALLLSLDEKIANELHKKSRQSMLRGQMSKAPHEKAKLDSHSNESDSDETAVPQSDRNFGVIMTIIEALLADNRNLSDIKNDSEEILGTNSSNQLNSFEETSTFTATDSSTDYQVEVTPLSSTQSHVQDIVPRFAEQGTQVWELEVTTEKMENATHNSTMPTNLLEEALLAKKPPTASDDVAARKKLKYHGENTTNHVKEETHILTLEELNFNIRGEDNNDTELTFVFAVAGNRPLINGSAGNLETVIRDLLRHEVGDETSDRLGIHFEISEGHLKYVIYARNGSLPPHMAEQVFKLKPNIESAFVHLASTHHEAPSAAIPHKRRGIPEWGILTVIVGIVFIAIITMRQAQKYCGRTHKALKPQELHEEKDAESMPTTSAANFMNPVYNST